MIQHQLPISTSRLTSDHQADNLCRAKPGAGALRLSLRLVLVLTQRSVSSTSMAELNGAPQIFTAPDGITTQTVLPEWVPAHARAHPDWLPPAGTVRPLQRRPFAVNSAAHRKAARLRQQAGLARAQTDPAWPEPKVEASGDGQGRLPSAERIAQPDWLRRPQATMQGVGNVTNSGAVGLSHRSQRLPAAPPAQLPGTLQVSSTFISEPCQ